MKNYRPNTTIFEHGALSKTQAKQVMLKKRQIHAEILNQKRVAHDDDDDEPKEKIEKADQEYATESDLQIFSQTFHSSKNVPKKQNNFKDKDHYISYVSSEHYKEKGLGLESTFERQAASAVLDLTGDDDQTSGKIKSSKKKWDRKKKRFVGDSGLEKSKKMKTESGAWIPKSYKSDLYKKWQEKNKVKYQQDESESDTDARKVSHFRGAVKGGGMKGKKSNKPPRRELKNKEEILKARNRTERLQSHAKKKRQLKMNRRKK
nr:ATP-dependent RNA helicase DDX54-like [Parasteatoda tepidariorum]